MTSKIRIGIGYDAHHLEKDRKLVLGGVEIPFRRGLRGWSDADIAEVNSAFSKITQKVIDDTAAQGLPAKEMVDEYYNALKAQGVANPIIGYTP